MGYLINWTIRIFYEDKQNIIQYNKRNIQKVWKRKKERKKEKRQEGRKEERKKERQEGRKKKSML